MPNDSFSLDVHKRSYDVTRDDVTETLPPQFGKQRFEPRGWGSSSASPPPTFQSRMQQNRRYEVTRGGETYHRQTESQRLGQRREVSSFNLFFSILIVLIGIYVLFNVYIYHAKINILERAKQSRTQQ